MVEDFLMVLHQAIEAKENVNIQEENQTLHQLLIKIILDLSKIIWNDWNSLTEAEEFYDIYKLNVFQIPTNRKMLRKDFNDQIFRTEKEKYYAIVNKINECNKNNNQF